MAEDWSLEEVEATVADYFGMLASEIRGEEFNKSEHRRRLMRLLGGRTEGAIERKHQNISAVLRDLGFDYITGYKPLRNYQQLLFDVVEDRLAANQPLQDLLRAGVSEPAAAPAIDDIDALLVDPPAPDPDPSAPLPMAVREPYRTPRGIDYLAIEARNRSLGLAGEEFVIRFEQARLVKAGCDRLAARVEHVSRTRGDGLGFDVLSFETSGRERLIEVKTTSRGAAMPFYVTRRELDVSRETADRYHLYRPFRFRVQPKLYMKAGPIDVGFSLDPSEYKATLA